jgi:hypothetical protein
VNGVLNVVWHREHAPRKRATSRHVEDRALRRLQRSPAPARRHTGFTMYHIFMVFALDLSMTYGLHVYV